MYMYTCMCIYIYIYTYIHTYMHTYIHMTSGATQIFVHTPFTDSSEVHTQGRMTTGPSVGNIDIS